MEHLFQNYGQINPNELLTKENDIRALTYDPKVPIDTLFEQIEDLVDISGYANTPMTPQQSINIAYTIMWKTSLFKEDLKTWNALADADKTWTRFKNHFCTAVTNHNKLSGPTVGDAEYQNQMNLMNEMKQHVKDTI